VTSVDIAPVSAERAFDVSFKAVAGRATHQILGGQRQARVLHHVRGRAECTQGVGDRDPGDSSRATVACVVCTK
ncbi:MAG: hypothetical protein ACREVJ_14130, partial [Gammaproteobacteria bacterium]